MKPTSSFKMANASKRLIALGKFKDSHDRGQFKRMMIDAQLAAEAAKHAKLDKSARDE
jgi:uncharacterized protein YciI